MNHIYWVSLKEDTKLPTLAFPLISQIIEIYNL
jgi:hypothetical protein